MEYKRKCNECGKVWHSLASREGKIERDRKSNECNQIASAMSCCNPAVQASSVQSRRNVEANEDLLDKLRKCPNCGSRNYTEEKVIYEKK